MGLFKIRRVQFFSREQITELGAGVSICHSCNIVCHRASVILALLTLWAQARAEDPAPVDPGAGGFPPPATPPGAARRPVQSHRALQQQ